MTTEQKPIDLETVRILVGLNFQSYNSGKFFPELVEHLDKHPMFYGWDARFKYIAFAHSDEREMAFTNNPQNTGMWTIVFSADDYYMHKLSDRAKKVILNNILQNAVVSVNPNSINLQSFDRLSSPFQATEFSKPFKVEPK